MYFVSILVPIVTTVHFAHNDKTRLACSSKDGTISVYSLHSDPPSLQVTCTGHKGPINGMYVYIRMYTRVSLFMFESNYLWFDYHFDYLYN